MGVWHFENVDIFMTTFGRKKMQNKNVQFRQCKNESRVFVNAVNNSAVF